MAGGGKRFRFLLFSGLLICSAVFQHQSQICHAPLCVHMCVCVASGSVVKAQVPPYIGLLPAEPPITPLACLAVKWWPGLAS